MAMGVVVQSIYLFIAYRVRSADVSMVLSITDMNMHECSFRVWRKYLGHLGLVDDVG